jgi:hypothetical protein
MGINIWEVFVMESETVTAKLLTSMETSIIHYLFYYINI